MAWQTRGAHVGKPAIGTSSSAPDGHEEAVLLPEAGCPLIHLAVALQRNLSHA